MARKKQIRINEASEHPLIKTIESDCKGKWQTLFKNKNDIIVELGCGKGVYTNTLAQQFPKKNFIGVDRKAERLWCGAHNNQSTENVRFLHIPIEAVESFFDKNEVSEIWITFPDPLPKKRQAKHRLTSNTFLKKYQTFLKKNALIHVKTDDEAFFNYSLEQLTQNGFALKEILKDIHSKKNLKKILQIETDFERKWKKQGKLIYYCKAELL